jgi:hypothetical protein
MKTQKAKCANCSYVCAMHEAAPDMFTALRDICIRYDVETAAYKIADAAITRAEGRAKR